MSTSTQKWHNLNDKLEQLRREKEREIETLKINHDNNLSTVNTQLDDMVGNCITVKYLYIQTAKNLGVIYLKFEQRGQTLGYFVEKKTGRANSEDTDQSAPLGTV